MGGWGAWDSCCWAWRRLAMSRQDRSRSPRGRAWNSERISRAIVSFGRYPRKRPSGLEVDASGLMRLEDIMSCWGRDEGLQEDEVLKAVKEHMFHNDEGAALRFAIDVDKAGRVTVQVKPSRRFNEGSPSGPGAKDKGRGQRPWRGEGQHHPGKGGGRLPARPTAREEEADGATSHHEGQRQTPWAKHRPKRPRGSAGQDWSDWRLGEQVQRWLAWVLKSGHKDLGIWVRPWKEGEDCWACLRDVVNAMREARTSWSSMDEEQLKELITDSEGRYQIEDGWVRKVPRKERWRGSSGEARSEEAWPATPPRGMAKAEPDDDDDGASGVREGPTPPRGPPPKRLLEETRPPPPPGEHWEQYKDDSQDKTWWAYEGPCGQWWTDDEAQLVPMRMKDEEPWP